MRDYETTFILAPGLDDEGIQREIEAIKKVVTSQKGEITAEKEWGRRRLAFPIRDCSEGVYHILRFTLDPKGLDELNRHFRLNENVLRALVIRDEKTPLDYVGQVSESEERDRDFRDRRPDRRGPRSEGRPFDRSAPASGRTTATATAPRPGGDEKPDAAAPATEGEVKGE